MIAVRSVNRSITCCSMSVVIWNTGTVEQIQRHRNTDGSSAACRGGPSPPASLHLSYLWSAGLELWQPEASSQHPPSAAPGCAPRSSPGDAGRQPEPISAAGFRPPGAAASALGGRPGPPCPCCCWLTRRRLEFRKKTTTTNHIIWVIIWH